MSVHKWLIAWCGGALLLFSTGLCPAGNWPQWRGPERSGHADEADLPLTWDGKTKENEWTLTGPSAAVSGGKLFLRGPRSLTCIGRM